MADNGNGMRTVRVSLAERSYDIIIGPGLLQQLGTRVSALRPDARCVIVTDANVNRLHGAAARESVIAAGHEAHVIEVQPGERSKSLEVLQSVISQMLDLKLERNDLLIALGGGIVGDLAGFAAAVYKRGMDFIQVPTSLLAQVDSSVGGKTGINAPQGKNLIGAFHQPVLVLADTGVLKTLPPREFAAGYAEIVKYGLINKPEFFTWLEDNRQSIFDFGPELAEAIAISCQAKADIVAEDEREGGVRALLNLGHTFGHALEGYVAYDAARLVHGEAVAIGMAQAHRYSNRNNLMGIEEAERVERHLAAAGLPVRVSQIPGTLPTAETLLGFIEQDKKVAKGKLTFILTKGIGKSYIARDVPPDDVLAFLKEDVSR